jgi:hypothetical protein
MPRHDTSFGLESIDGHQLAGTPFPWFDNRSYPRILEVMVDSDLLPQTYDRWLKQATRVLEKSHREGQRPIRAHIDPDKFLAWCQDNDWPPDGMARLAYAGYVARLTLLPDETGELRVLTAYET